MPKRSLDIKTTKSDTDIAKLIEDYLIPKGFTRKASKKKQIWRKGFIWSIFVSLKVAEGVAHVEVWNYAPIPGMGSYLMYFLNMGKLPELLESIEAVIGGRAALESKSSQELRYAGFWRRFLATFIDGLLCYVIIGLITAIIAGISAGVSSETQENWQAMQLMLMNVITIVSIIGAWLYFAFLESSDAQATLGKRAVAIKVTDIQGQRISFGKASGRFWGKSISTFIMGIGFLLAAFTGKKQALHDFMARTLVVRR
jgi:uncharacterized RDD family membrane protein YckC